MGDLWSLLLKKTSWNPSAFLELKKEEIKQRQTEQEELA
jgi:serine/arginine repetitive matrix protein 1